jgi:hypothetical protein
MTTKREYLASKGITVGRRGRFSSAANKALQDAAAQGVVFQAEQQVAELLCNYSEDHFFNPASLGGFLADQPTYTLDRIMEVVTWVIEKQARRYEREVENGGLVSEGLALAYKLDQVVDKIKEKNTFNNLKLPITNQERKAIIDRMPKEKTGDYKYSWLHETNNTNKQYIDQSYM